MKCNNLFKEAHESVTNWVKSSDEIVNKYLQGYKDKGLEAFFKEAKPSYSSNTYRVGMLDKNLHLKEGNIVTNIFPFASSKNSEENQIFEHIASNKVKNMPNKVVTKFVIDNSKVPQYDLQALGHNKAETEVLIKPDTKFIVDDVHETPNKRIIRLRAITNAEKRLSYRGKKEAIPLLGLAGAITYSSHK